MGGSVENFIESLLIRLFMKVPVLKCLENRQEREVASAHLFFMVSVGLAFDLAACWSGFKWIALGAILSFLLVVIAELRQGRLIDWITRSAGWFVGVVPALLIMVGL